MKRGFTLIELLIVVAIIAILAAIAVPNFLEAQTRSKISRTKADMRTLGIAIESYNVDNNRPPLSFEDWQFLKGVPVGRREGCYTVLTTPIPYMSSLLEDPFAKYVKDINPTQSRADEKYYFYTHFYSYNIPGLAAFNARRQFCKDRGFTWGTYSVGPVPVEEAPYLPELMGGPNGPNKTPVSVSMGRIYDPTNGTLSKGRIIRSNKGEFTGNDVPRE